MLTTKETNVTLAGDAYAEYHVIAVDKNNVGVFCFRSR